MTQHSQKNQRKKVQIVFIAGAHRTKQREKIEIKLGNNLKSPIAYYSSLLKNNLCSPIHRLLPQGTQYKAPFSYYLYSKILNILGDM